jgi:hypothetical protein
MADIYPKYALPAGGWTTDREYADRIQAKHDARRAAEDGIFLQNFKTREEAVDGIDEFDAFLKLDPRLKDLSLIVSRPRQEAGGWALYAIPRPGTEQEGEEA